MPVPDYEGQKLLDLLVRKLYMVTPGDPSTYVTYGHTRQELQLPEPNVRLGETDGTVLQEHGLNALADWTKAEGKPMITGIIVNQAEPRMPSSGYFALNDSGLPDADWWVREVRRSVKHDWFADVTSEVRAELRARQQAEEEEAEEAEPPDTPKSFDTRDPTGPHGVIVEVYRALRDTALARRIKERHKHVCQVCGAVLELLGGKRYAEGHHIKPLGRAYGGDDVEGNILCVCPRCRVLLDYGAMRLDPATLRKVDGHEVDDAMVDYHNEKLYGKK